MPDTFSSRYYQHALALTGELGMRPLQAHCHPGLGTLYRWTGREALARAALSTAIEMYHAMDTTVQGIKPLTLRTAPASAVPHVVLVK